MCQLNSYFIPKALDSEKVLEIMRECGFFNPELMDDYKEISQFSDYNAYCAAGQRCNCGSIISQLATTNYQTFANYKIQSVREKVAELEKIRDLMLSEDYELRLKKYETKLNNILKRMRKLSAALHKHEIALTDEVMRRSDISDQEKSRLMHETVYPEIHKLLEEHHKTPEYIKVIKESEALHLDNELLAKSSAFTLKVVEPEIHNAVPLTLSKSIELAGYTPSEKDEEESKVMTFTMPSNNIDDVIEREKNNDFAAQLDEFAIIKKFINAVLEYTDHLQLFAYWQTDECVIKETKSINSKDFTIDSLLFLPYLTLLEIRK